MFTVSISGLSAETFADGELVELKGKSSGIPVRVVDEASAVHAYTLKHPQAKRLLREGQSFTVQHDKPVVVQPVEPEIVRVQEAEE